MCICLIDQGKRMQPLVMGKTLRRIVRASVAQHLQVRLLPHPTDNDNTDEFNIPPLDPLVRWNSACTKEAEAVLKRGLDPKALQQAISQPRSYGAAAESRLFTLGDALIVLRAASACRLINAAVIMAIEAVISQYSPSAAASTKFIPLSPQRLEIQVPERSTTMAPLRTQTVAHTPPPLPPLPSLGGFTTPPPPPPLPGMNSAPSYQPPMPANQTTLLASFTQVSKAIRPVDLIILFLPLLLGIHQFDKANAKTPHLPSGTLFDRVNDFIDKLFGAIANPDFVYLVESPFVGSLRPVAHACRAIMVKRMFSGMELIHLYLASLLVKPDLMQTIGRAISDWRPANITMERNQVLDFGRLLSDCRPLYLAETLTEVEEMNASAVGGFGASLPAKVDLCQPFNALCAKILELYRPQSGDPVFMASPRNCVALAVIADCAFPPNSVQFSNNAQLSQIVAATVEYALQSNEAQSSQRHGPFGQRISKARTENAARIAEEEGSVASQRQKIFPPRHYALMLVGNRLLPPNVNDLICRSIVSSSRVDDDDVTIGHLQALLACPQLQALPHGIAALRSMLWQVSKAPIGAVRGSRAPTTSQLLPSGLPDPRLDPALNRTWWRALCTSLVSPRAEWTVPLIFHEEFELAGTAPNDAPTLAVTFLSAVTQVAVHGKDITLISQAMLLAATIAEQWTSNGRSFLRRGDEALWEGTSATSAEEDLIADAARAVSQRIPPTWWSSTVPGRALLLQIVETAKAGCVLASKLDVAPSQALSFWCTMHDASVHLGFLMDTHCPQSAEYFSQRKYGDEVRKNIREAATFVSQRGGASGPANAAKQVVAAMNRLKMCCNRLVSDGLRQIIEHELLLADTKKPGSSILSSCADAQIITSVAKAWAELFPRESKVLVEHCAMVCLFSHKGEDSAERQPLFASSQKASMLGCLGRLFDALTRNGEWSEKLLTPLLRYVGSECEVVPSAQVYSDILSVAATHENEFRHPAVEALVAKVIQRLGDENALQHCLDERYTSLIRRALPLAKSRHRPLVRRLYKALCNMDLELLLNQQRAVRRDAHMEPIVQRALTYHFRKIRSKDTTSLHDLVTLSGSLLVPHGKSWASLGEFTEAVIKNTNVTPSALHTQRIDVGTFASLVRKCNTDPGIDPVSDQVVQTLIAYLKVRGGTIPIKRFCTALSHLSFVPSCDPKDLEHLFEVLLKEAATLNANDKGFHWIPLSTYLLFIRLRCAANEQSLRCTVESDDGAGDVPLPSSRHELNRDLLASTISDYALDLMYSQSNFTTETLLNAIHTAVSTGIVQNVPQFPALCEALVVRLQVEQASSLTQSYRKARLDAASAAEATAQLSTGAADTGIASDADVALFASLQQMEQRSYEAPDDGSGVSTGRPLLDMHYLLSRTVEAAHEIMQRYPELIKQSASIANFVSFCSSGDESVSTTVTVPFGGKEAL